MGCNVVVIGTDHPELRSWVRWGLVQAGPTPNGRRQVGGRQKWSELRSGVVRAYATEHIGGSRGAASAKLPHFLNSDFVREACLAC